MTLSDLQAGTHAQLVPSFGFPCIAFRVALDAGVWNVVSEPPDGESFRTRVGRYGVPIMYPWPNRIREGRFTFDARAWAPIMGRLIDDVYTCLNQEGGWFTAEIYDPGSERIVAVRSNSAFREHVLFAPHHADVVCLEPYTCTTDAFNLSARGLDAGTVVLGPGERWRGAMEIVAHP